MNIRKIKPGTHVYFAVRHRLGNTTAKTTSIHTAFVVSVDLASERVTANISNESARSYGRTVWSKWRETKPLLVKQGFGARLATKAEELALRQEQATRP